MRKIIAVKKIILVIVMMLLAVYFSTVKAIDTLDYARDTISTNSLGALASHNIRFSLPVGSEPIVPTDFIMVEFTYFSGVTEATSLIGDYTGTPVFTVIGNRAKITGISVNPGTSLNIRGITAFNPTEPNLFDVYIYITEDSDGLIIKNMAHVIATKTDGSIVISASVEAEVGILRISGFTSPDMFLSFLEGGSVIGTAVAGASGAFSQIFPGISPTNHSILIFGTDSDSRTTPNTLVEVFTRPHEVTTVSGIIIPPTIEIDKTQIIQGETITITGRGTPGYTLKLFTEPPVNSFEMIVDPNGDYSYALSDTANLELGDHKLYALVQDTLGTQSLLSLTLFFRVVDNNPPPGGNPGCDISKGDLNCDGLVDLTDFSILLYYWGLDEPVADINSDGNVNLIDFSIMMFYWQG